MMHVHLLCVNKNFLLPTTVNSETVCFEVFILILFYMCEAAALVAHMVALHAIGV